MLQIAVGMLLTQRSDEAFALQQTLTDHSLYLFQDKGTMLYLGQSKKVLQRARGHLGLGTKGYTSSVGRLIYANSPLSHHWQCTFFTQQECLDLLPADAFFPVEHAHSSWSLSRYLQQKERTLSLPLIEKLMIQYHKTCLNIDDNPYRTPLPSTYRLPANDLPEGLVCTTHPEVSAFQVSYKAYEWKSHQKHEYMVIMHAHVFWECRNTVIKLLGFLPEKLHVASYQGVEGISAASEEQDDEEDLFLGERESSIESLWWCSDCDELHSESVCPKLQIPSEQRQSDETYEGEEVVQGEEVQESQLPESRKLLHLTPEVLFFLSPYSRVMKSWEATTDGYSIEKISDACDEKRFHIHVSIRQRTGGIQWLVQWWTTALDEPQDPIYNFQVLSTVSFVFDFLIDLHVPYTPWIYQHILPRYAHTLWEPF